MSPTVPMVPLVIFDLDGTLTRRDTFLPYLVTFALRCSRPGPLLTLPLPIAAYLGRVVHDSTAKQWVLTQFLAGQPRDRIAEHTAWFCRRWLPRNLHPVGMQLLDAHLRQSHRVILLSASPDIYVQAVASALGISEAVCTQVCYEDDVCTGRLVSGNCKGEAKVRSLQAYLGVDRAPEGSYAYGDSPHDLPLLTWVEQGYRVTRRGVIPVGSGLEKRQRSLSVSFLSVAELAATSANGDHDERN